MKVTFKLEFNPTIDDIQKYGTDPRTAVNKYIEDMIIQSKADYNNPEKWNVDTFENATESPASPPETADQQAPQKQGARVGPDVRTGNFNDPFAGTSWGNK
tara:strand:- start:16642 stop:16944 length:303 start_codon:yes stop_codon:yes gene_type:complete